MAVGLLVMNADSTVEVNMTSRLCKVIGAVEVNAGAGSVSVPVQGASQAFGCFTPYDFPNVSDPNPTHVPLYPSFSIGQASISWPARSGIGTVIVGQLIYGVY